MFKILMGSTVVFMLLMSASCNKIMPSNEAVMNISKSVPIEFQYNNMSNKSKRYKMELPYKVTIHIINSIPNATLYINGEPLNTSEGKTDLLGNFQHRTYITPGKNMIKLESKNQSLEIAIETDGKNEITCIGKTKKEFNCK